MARSGDGATARASPLGIDTGDFRYRAFISYSWADRKWGEWLHHALETYRAPKGVAAAALKPIFKDREEEAAGHSIGAAIEAAMGSSEFLIVLCSPRSAASEWVNREVAWFKTHRDPKKILTLIVDGEPMASRTPGREGEECFPKTLLYKTGADLLPTEEFEDAPLAADARETGDGKRGAKLKLAAAMLGLGLDTLVNRDNRRRAERRRLVYAGLGSLSLVLGGLSLFAFNQRDAAVAAQMKAEAAEKDAKFQAEEAQSLVEFMLTDFRQELDSLGRLDVLERTGKRLLESFAKQDVAKLDANALGRRARVQLLLGEVDNTRGNLDAALARYKEAATTTEELLRRNPGSAQQIFDHAQSVFWVGYIAWQRGDAVLAKRQFTQYYDLAQQLVAIDPDKDEWRMELKYALNNLGTLAMDEGEAAEAERYFREALEIVSKLAEARPDDIDRLVSIGQAYAWLADSHYIQAEIEEAHAARLAELATYARILSTNPEHVEAKTAALNASNGLALIEIASNEPARAAARAQIAAITLEDAWKKEPNNMEYAEKAANAFTILAKAQLMLGKKTEARASLNTALTFGARLIAKDDSVALWRGKILAQPMLELAQIDAVEKSISQAIIGFERVSAIMRVIIKAKKADNIMLRRYCAAIAGRARLSQEYSSGWAEIASMLAPLASKQGPEALTLLAEAYQQTAKVREAAAIAEKLHAAGYGHPDFLALLEKYPELMPSAELAASAQ